MAARTAAGATVSLKVGGGVAAVASRGGGGPDGEPRGVPRCCRACRRGWGKRGARRPHVSLPPPCSYMRWGWMLCSVLCGYRAGELPPSAVLPLNGMAGGSGDPSGARCQCHEQPPLQVTAALCRGPKQTVAEASLTNTGTHESKETAGCDMRLERSISTACAHTRQDRRRMNGVLSHLLPTRRKRTQTEASTSANCWHPANEKKE